MMRDHGDETPREGGIRRKSDNKLLTIYIVLVIYSIITLGIGGRALETSRSNCERFNSALDYFNANAQAPASPLTAQQKADRARHYDDLHGRCVGIWPFS